MRVDGRDELRAIFEATVMVPFRYISAASLREALSMIADSPDAQFIAGGTSQVDLLKEGVQRPSLLIDISRIGLQDIQPTASGGLIIGANVSNADAAVHPVIQSSYTVVAEALLAGASQQIRNMASFAGNLLQRTRCSYLRDAAQPCNKREPGSGCGAVAGYQRIHAIFGQGSQIGSNGTTCIATHPSDLAVALVALDAIVHVEGGDGGRRIALESLLRLPGDKPERDTNLARDELIVGIELPAFTGVSHYLKVRDRASYAYALVSCGVAIERHGDRITRARIALGGVAHKPWRVPVAEAMLPGHLAARPLFQRVAERALVGSFTYPLNAYKPALARALIERALCEVSGLAPLQGRAGSAFASSVGGIAGMQETP